MSMTSQKARSNAQKSVKNLIQTGNWSKTFPSKIETETKSCVFVKKLLTVSISNITYLRSMFPEEAYADRSMDGLPLKILMEKNKCKEAATLASWLIGAFDALERRYLKELLFIIYMDPACPEKVYEMYTFKFTYPGGQVACQMLQGENKKEVQTMHPDDVYKSTQNLLRSIIELTQSLRPLPSSAHLSMKLTYYEDVTPEDYEPAGFGPADHGEVQLLPGSLHLCAGEVSTGHHTVKLKVHAMQVEETRDQPTIVTNTFSASASESDSDPRVVNVGQAGDFVPLSSIPSISCTCQNTTPDPLMLECLHCSKQQHAACYRLTKLARLPAGHCCVDCSKEGQGDRVCTDTRLVKMASKPAVVLTCIFRRVLVSLLGRENVGEEFLVDKFGLSWDISVGVLTKLEKEGTILRTGTGDFRVDKRSLEMVAVPKYLGVRRVETRNLESILEKTREMDIGENLERSKNGLVDEGNEMPIGRENDDEEMDVEEQGGRSKKRQRECGEEERCGSGGREEELLGGRRRSKRIKSSKADDFVKLAKE
eukprot:GFUD01025312.1.p1 GENE.GFUD01025312.1~~GFUD01025312.1.p1  ORF type:complete len:538 (-),score=191.36 GFUD01025312.1:59-1672(-)